MYITKDGIEVKPGQVWRDLDKRMSGRHVLVVELSYTGSCQTKPAAIVARCTPDGTWSSKHTTVLSIRRMHKHSTGWALVGDHG